MKQAGFYIIKDQFFTDMSDPYLKGNKDENRPHCVFLIQDMFPVTENYIEREYTIGKNPTSVHVGQKWDFAFFEG